jgi:hypothetical protein
LDEHEEPMKTIIALTLIAVTAAVENLLRPKTTTRSATIPDDIRRYAIDDLILQ